jgi:hypothetical protein
MSRIISVLGILCALAGAAAADSTRAAVERMLSAYEPTHTPDDLRRVGGANLDRVLIAIATDEHVSSTVHRRALAALGFVPSAAGLELLRAIIRRNPTAKEGLDGVDVEVCARTLPRFGPTVFRDLVALLMHPAVDARRFAAAGLAELGLPEARAPLSLRLAAERDPDVQASLVRALAVLDAAQR